MIKANVLVVADKATGEVARMRTITNKDGSTREVGVVMVQSKTLSGLSALGRVSTRTAFITLEEEALDFLMESGSLKNGHQFPIEGKICIEETLTPYVRKNGTPQEAKINPSTGEIITYNGDPVYRNSFFTEDLNHSDVFLRENSSVLASTGADEQDAPE